MRIGILDHTAGLGGAQLVVSRMVGVLASKYDVELIHNSTPDYVAKLASAFSLNLGKARERRLPQLKSSFNVPGAGSIFTQSRRDIRRLSEPYDVFIYSGHGIPPRCFAPGGIVYCHFPIESSPLNSLRTSAEWARQTPVARAIKTKAYEWEWRSRTRNYRQIFANSRFTAEWIERRWDRASEVLYPPIDVVAPALEKRNVIVSVGRVTGESRSKNQVVQVRAFREFLKQVRNPWILRMIGSCGDTPKDREYAAAIRREANGLPIELFFNARHDVVLELLATAKVFWHTTGLDVDEAQQPERAEHFGIATVEAMGAGCLPVVVASGGQREIIQDGDSGFLIKNLQDLVQQSIRLASDEALANRMRERARLQSTAFRGEFFEQRLMKAVDQSVQQR